MFCGARDFSVRVASPPRPLLGKGGTCSRIRVSFSEVFAGVAWTLCIEPSRSQRACSLVFVIPIK